MTRNLAVNMVKLGINDAPVAVLPHPQAVRLYRSLTMPDSTPDSKVIQLSLLDYDPDTVAIPLTRGQITIVDAADSDLQDFKWYAQQHRDGDFYARRDTHLPNGGGRESTIYIHRVILSRIIGRDLDKNEYPDHKNGNKLDNRRKNLRLANRITNAQNRKRNSNSTSGYKGVSQLKSTGRWQAKITINKQRRAVGCFDTPEEAHEAYKKAATEHYGEFARFE